MTVFMAMGGPKALQHMQGCASELLDESVPERPEKQRLSKTVMAHN